VKIRPSPSNTTLTHARDWSLSEGIDEEEKEKNKKLMVVKKGRIYSPHFAFFYSWKSIVNLIKTDFYD
jgi:hypothetical protein